MAQKATVITTDTLLQCAPLFKFMSNNRPVVMTASRVNDIELFTVIIKCH